MHLLLLASLAGTFVFALSGAMTAVQRRLDVFGAIVLATVVGITGGVLRDVLIGVPPAAVRDWRYLTAAGVAAVAAILAHPTVSRLQRTIDVLDAAGLGLFATTGATLALGRHLPASGAIALGVISAVGGGAVRDVLVADVPSILHGPLYAVPALLGSAIAVALRAGAHTTLLAAILAGTVACFALRLVALTRDLTLPRAGEINLARRRRPSRRT